MKKYAWIAGSFVVLVFIVTDRPIVSRFRTSDSHSSLNACEAHLKRIGVAFSLYADDNDGYLPPSAKWMDALSKYLPKDMFECLNRPTGSASGYAVRQGLEGRKLADVQDKGFNVIVFESSVHSWNAVASLSTMPLPSRHPKGNYVLLGDGKVVAYSTRDKGGE